MKTIEELNKEVASRCSVRLLTKEEATQVLLKPVIAAIRGRGPQDVIDDAKDRDQLCEWTEQAALREDGEDCSTGNPSFATKTQPVDKVAVIIPTYWMIEAEMPSGLHYILRAYKTMSLKVNYEFIAEQAGFYYGMCWIGDKPTEEINKAKSFFER